MKISIISSSQRIDSQSKRVGEYITQELNKKGVEENIHLDLVNFNLPFFDTTLKTNTELQKLWVPISQILSESDAFVFITPEWNGMASPLLKNFFMYTNNQELSHKPALLVSVSSGMNGAYPIAELRSSSYKNNHICYIPNHVIVRFAEQCFIDETLNPENKADQVARTRINNSLNILLAYSKAMSSMRQDQTVNWNEFPNGM